MTARDSAVQDYNTNYLGSAITSNGWTGSTTMCSAGTVSASSDVQTSYTYTTKIFKP